jgi:hypothetical protein
MPTPTDKSRSSSKRTPFEETFLVRAGTPPEAVSTTTGSMRGKRTAQRTSWRPRAESDSCVRGEKAEFRNFIVRTQDSVQDSVSDTLATLTEFISVKNGTKVSRRVTSRMSQSYSFSYVFLQLLSGDGCRLMVRIEGGRSADELAPAIVVHSHHLAATQTHEGERRGEPSPIRP